MNYAASTDVKYFMSESIMQLHEEQGFRNVICVSRAYGGGWKVMLAAFDGDIVADEPPWVIELADGKAFFRTRQEAETFARRVARDWKLQQVTEVGT